MAVCGKEGLSRPRSRYHRLARRQHNGGGIRHSPALPFGDDVMGEAATPKFVECGLGPVPYYFNVTGPKAGQALQKDAAVQRLRPFRNQPGTPGYRELVEEFKASPASGCATVLDQLRRRAGYVPAHPNPSTLTMFNVYLKQHPLFAELPFDSFQFEIKAGMGQPT